MKTRRYTWILAGLGIVLGLSLSACRSKENRFSAALKAASENALRSNPPRIDIGSVTDFKWDRLFIFGPYTSTNTINSALGYQWPEASRTGLEMSDTFNLLVFERNGQVVEYFKVPRFTDFDAVQSRNPFLFGAATFDVQRAAKVSDSDRFILRPASTGIQKGQTTGHN